MAPRILFIFTSAEATLTGGKTGAWLAEAAHPYYVLHPHFEVEFASPKKTWPVDPNSIQAAEQDKDESSLKYSNDDSVQFRQRNGYTLDEVRVNDYIAVFFVGGHGPVLDLASDPKCAQIIQKFWEQDKYIAAVCHGPAALVGAKDENGKSIFAGKKVTGFSNDEEKMVGREKEIPFLLEDRIKELGGKYEKAEKPWEPHVVVDGKLLTGQNPKSAEPLAKRLFEVLAPKLHQ